MFRWPPTDGQPHKAMANHNEAKLFGEQAAEGQTARLRLGKTPLAPAR
jgi:hypothetical protein